MEIRFRCRFNPTLVRLRLGLKRAGLEPFVVFQSHAGSIEAVDIDVVTYPVAGVSIPRWFD